MSYWRKIRTTGMGKHRWCTRYEAKESSRRKRRREDKLAAEIVVDDFREYLKSLSDS